MGTYNPKLPTKHKGTDKTITFFVTRDRRPTGADYRQPETGTLYSTGTVWQVGKNPTTGAEGDLWMLSKIVANVAYWVQVGSGSPPVGGVLTLSDTANTLVFPTVLGNIQLEAAAGLTITSDPGSNKLVFALGGGGTAIDEILVDAFTAPGTNPVVPTAAGRITVTGSIVANAGIPLRTNSLAANTYAIQLQVAKHRTGAPANTADVGASSFDDVAFTVDANGYVQLKGAGQATLSTTVDATSGTGVNPVVPNASGTIAVSGLQVATGQAGTQGIRTRTNAPNAWIIELQQSTTAAAKNTALNGSAHFNSAHFTVDEGFVSLSSTPPSYETGTFTPVVQTSNGDMPTPTYSVQIGRYTKIGNRVFTTVNLAFTKGNGGTGAVIVTGMPFTFLNVTDLYPMGAVTLGGFTTIASSNGLSVRGDYNTTQAVLLKSQDSQPISAVSVFNTGGTITIEFNLDYETA